MASFSNSNSNVNKSSPNTNSSNSKNAIWKAVSDDFNPNNGGDQKILRAIARTATVNAVIAGTAVFGPIAAVAGYATGGAITAKRLVGNGIIDDNKKEIVKSLAVFSSATTCSVAGQALTGAVMIGVVGASLPVAGAIAFAVGCVSGITGGALSEWGVDGVMVENAGNSSNSMTKQNEKDDDNDKIDKKNIVDSLFNWNKNCRRQQWNKKCPSQINSVFGNRNKDKKKQQLEDARRMQEELIKEQMKTLALDNEVEALEGEKVMQEQLVQEIIDKKKADESIGSSSWETNTADKDMEGEDTEQHQLQHELQDYSSEINNDLVTQLSPVVQPTTITTHETLIQADQKKITLGQSIHSNIVPRSKK